MSTSSSPTSSTPSKRTRRPSKFIEGSEATGPDMLQRTPTSNELFITILSEMDECEKRRRQHRGSNSSVDSFTSSNGAHEHGPVKGNKPGHTEPESPKEGRRSLNFGRSLEVREALSGIVEENGRNGEKLAQKVKGRLRALTGGKETNVEPYPGT